MLQDVKYNGMLGSKIGIFLKERLSVPTAKKRYKEYDIPGRDGVLTETYEDYEPEEIELKFNFISKNEREWNARTTQAKEWLMSSRKEISFSDDLEHFYRVRKIELSEIERKTARVGEFSAKVYLESALRYLVSGTRETDAAGVKVNRNLPCHPIYKVTGEGMCTLTVNKKSMTANVGQNLTIDTELMLAYRKDGTLNNTAVTGNYEDLYLKSGENTISISSGFDLKIIPNWRCL